MSTNSKKAPKPPRVRDEKPAFDPYWNRRAGAVDSQAKYIQDACREPQGFHRGARIK